MVHPEPPKDPASLAPVLGTFRASVSWWRAHRLTREPLHFGRGSLNRFDAPAGEFGVLYVGADAHCAFIETFGHATGTRSVTEVELASVELSTIRSSRALKLVDLRAEGLARLGADAGLTSGFDYPLAQRWARALYDHPQRPDGIAYLARHDPSRTSAALFDRVATTLTAKRTGPLSAPSNRKLLGRLLETYSFALL